MGRKWNLSYLFPSLCLQLKEIPKTRKLNIKTPNEIKFGLSQVQKRYEL